MNGFDIIDIIQAIWKFRDDERGQALAEYSLILGFLAMVCIIALTGIGLAVTGQLDSFASAIGGGGS